MKFEYELNKFSIGQIKQIHSDIQKIRKINSLDEYPSLSELSNGKL